MKVFKKYIGHFDVYLYAYVDNKVCLQECTANCISQNSCDKVEETLTAAPANNRGAMT
ncbi:hypothetical protein IOC57_24490 [Bacillus sp. SD075]|uniref:hypothetical protein n=1 Tax=Bacillus sp. SD075 TaxID=2781732 RepID=UPI001A9744FB|nr:hypothetical protein [Bacillus sp. SD075]MBO1000878.1 hypothetical protein [Bacillus sp. SD075]